MAANKFPKVLFILKKREQTWGVNNYSCSFSSGLLNSATFVKDMLVKNGLEAKLVEVIDNNDIDREVTKFRPDVVLIEAFWCVPEKFDELKRLHPKIKWLVRNHSAVPFAANEGIIIDWSLEYLKRGVYVSCNLEHTNEDFAIMARNSGLKTDKIVYLPNYYPVSPTTPPRPPKDGKTVKIGCFGATRILKNQLVQAVAALKFANDINKKLIYYINGGRLESGGDTVIKSIRSLFKHVGNRAQLVEVDWLPHAEFKKLAGSLDLNLQVSYSETFNVVAADAVDEGCPVVVSPEIFWASKWFQADPNFTEDIVEKMHRAYDADFWENFFFSNKRGLARYSAASEKIWLETLKKI